MEPCSVRTSGGPSCALELVKAGVKRVWLGVEEPPDFVQCQGVNLLLEGGIEVGRVAGLEDDCLKAARRGRD
jgi:pyrimidine deaminase RibD-like protein